MTTCTTPRICCWCKKEHNDGMCCDPAHRVQQFAAKREPSTKDRAMSTPHWWKREPKRSVADIAADLATFAARLPQGSRWRYRNTGDDYTIDSVSIAAGDLRRAGFRFVVTYRSVVNPAAVFTKKLDAFVDGFDAVAAT